MANLIDKALAWLSPEAGVRRAQARQVLAHYEAAQKSRTRKALREGGSGNTAVQRAGNALREQARHLEQNHDLARGVLDVLVRNTVGTGIGVEPQPRTKSGEIHAELANQLQLLWKDFSRRPEVTWMHDRASAERLMARTWYRDGEVFAQRVLGLSPSLDHGTKVPYSIEMLEPDFVPFYLMGVPGSAGQNAVIQGVEINGWGRPLGYHVLRQHPGEIMSVQANTDTKRISADRMLHLRMVDRIRQYRGVSVFASVLARLDDLKDYEESERIAAKVAASMAAYIKKGSPDMLSSTTFDDDTGARRLRFAPGMIFDDLRPGEDIGTIDTNRPNPNLQTYRQGQLRAVASGTFTSYSSVAKDYGGSYSSQRQELVESWGAYQILAGEFISRVTRPVYEDVVAMAVAARLITLPRDLAPDSLNDAIYIAPQMPWIDPLKEATAFETMEDRAYMSGPEIIRRRGANPADVLDQQARWLSEKDKRGIPSAQQADGKIPQQDNQDGAQE